MAKSPKQRQEEVSLRRKESGLSAKKCYFPEYTLLGIECVSERLGYTGNDLKSNENISYILDYCVSVTLSFLEDEDLELIPKNKNSQYLYKLRQIAKFRVSEGDTEDKIVQHMNKWQYKTPTLVRNMEGKQLLDSPKAWKRRLVEILLDDNIFNQQVCLLNKFTNKP